MEASDLIINHLSDPRLGFCTVTRVDLTNDLSYCTVFVSVMGEEGVKSRTMHALQDARGLIQSHIAKRMRTRTTPHVTVELDDSIERSFNVINKIKEARASDPDHLNGPPAEPPEADGDDESDAESDKDE